MMMDHLNAALEGRYHVERELGEGGMARVFLAEDLKHDRRVAIKVLKPELAAVVGAERFLAEIKTTANLQHPHILPLHDSGETDGFLFYVMPYVEGDSLRDRLSREKQLPVDEAVRIATDVAEALDHAHRHGVIHRDVKPANILLQDGRPVVADFGIALAVSAAGGGRLTETGLSLGTPYYMSPEQATGDREVDARSDTYALACVVYEMLTGEPPYTGSTAQAVLGRILMGEVQAPTVHRTAIPVHVEHALLKALEKLPADRFASAQAFADALRNPAFRDDKARQARGGPPSAGARRIGRPSPTVLGVAVASAIVAGAVGWVAARGRVQQPVVERSRILLGNGPERISELVAFRGAIHPRGEGIIYADTAMVDGRTSLRTWWKAREALEPTRLASMDGALTPTFSPDGEWLLFVQNGDLRKQPLVGGNSVTLAPEVSGGTAHALAWLEDGTIVYENTGFTLFRIREDGQGEPTLVATEDRTGQPIHMSGLPGGWGVLVSACVDSCPAGTQLSLLDLEADTVVKLTDNVVRAWPAPGGRVIYLTRQGAVFVARLDRASRSLGPPFPLLSGVRVSPDANGEMHVAPDGSVLYVRGSAATSSYVPSVVDRTGRAGALNRASLPPQPYTALVLSPDGRKVAVTIAGSTGEQLWVADMGGGPLIPLTPNEASASRPDWFADGSRIAYVSLDGQRHARTIRADGTSQSPDTLLTDAIVYEVELTAGRDTFVMRANNTSANADLFMVDPTDDAEPEPLLATSFGEFAAALSPDRRWLAYVSDVSGRPEVYVRPFPDVSAGQIAVSLNGGSEPLWARDGNTIFYRDGGGWMVAAQVSASDSVISVEGRERLFDASAYAVHNGWRGYDVMPDGRFLMLLPGPGTVAEVGDLVLVENFFQEVEEATRR
jgi:hypothetical protein